MDMRNSRNDGDIALTRALRGVVRWLAPLAGALFLLSAVAPHCHHLGERQACSDPVACCAEAGHTVAFPLRNAADGQLSAVTALPVPPLCALPYADAPLTAAEEAAADKRQPPYAEALHGCHTPAALGLRAPPCFC
jgi:hypothetical protein